MQLRKQKSHCRDEKSKNSIVIISQFSYCWYCGLSGTVLIKCTGELHGVTQLSRRLRTLTHQLTTAETDDSYVSPNHLRAAYEWSRK